MFKKILKSVVRVIVIILLWYVVTLILPVLDLFLAYPDDYEVVGIQDRAAFIGVTVIYTILVLIYYLRKIMKQKSHA